MDARLELAERLAVELRGRGLVRHLEQLRRYYAATRDGRSAEWDEEHVRRLAGVFGVLPGLEVRPAGSGCCDGFLARTVVAVGERYVLGCSGCGREWLVVGATEAQEEPGLRRLRQ